MPPFISGGTAILPKNFAGEHGLARLATWAPSSVAVDADGNVYVTDRLDNIRKFTPAGDITTLAGTGAPGATNGDGMTATFDAPIAVAVDGNGVVYVADRGNNQIRKIRAVTMP